MEKIPQEFRKMLKGFKDLKQAYLSAWNADNRSNLEERFIDYCNEYNLVRFA